MFTINMKGFFKKIAFVMALAMVLTNIGSVATASAAPAPGLRFKSRVIYVGGSAFGDYADWCWTPSNDAAKGYKVTYNVISGANIITVGTNGKIVATGNAIGKAVVRVSYAKAGEKTITDDFTVRVRRNATDVRLTNTTKAFIDEALEVGATVDLQAAKSIATPASYAKGNYGLNNFMKVSSDQITYRSSDENVFTVETNKDGIGKITAVGSGTATLTVIAYEFGDKNQDEVVKRKYTITVLGGWCYTKNT